MLCPQCKRNHKYADGMTCACGYRFALNPKQAPHISDMGFIKMRDRLSMNGEFYFTQNQLIAKLHRLLQKKRIGHWGCLGMLSGICTIIAVFVLMFLFPEMAVDISGDLLILILILFFIFFTILFWFLYKPEVPFDQANSLIERYTQHHRLNRLATGSRLNYMESKGMEGELLSHFPPERILIVQRDDLAEMLILNRFHFHHKTLVVSAQRYPKKIFDICQRLLMQSPDIPVMILHDLSRSGMRMESKLREEGSWNLANRDIRDLGLRMGDIEKLKKAVWFPGRSLPPAKRKIRKSKKAVAMYQSGYRVPADLAPPRFMMGMLGLSLTTGLAFLSPELMAHMQDDTGGSSGGFG